VGNIATNIKMSSTKRYVLFGGLAIAVVAAIYGYKEFNRKPEDLSNISPQAIVTVDSIVAAFSNDEATANKKYLGKTIQVSGMITEVNNQQDTLLNVVLGNTESINNVSCLLDKKQLTNLKYCTVGKPISIKGICTGFLADVELNRCVIIENNLK
jgi:tRNA_anti-like